MAAARAKPAPDWGSIRANQSSSVSGVRRESNFYSIDGISNTEVNYSDYIFLPSIDAIQEFKARSGTADGKLCLVGTAKVALILSGACFELHSRGLDHGRGAMVQKSTAPAMSFSHFSPTRTKSFRTVV